MFIISEYRTNERVDHYGKGNYTLYVFADVPYEDHPGNNLTHRVYIYGKVGCGFCNTAREHLEEHGVAYSYISLDLIPYEQRGAVVRGLKERSDNKLYLPVLEFGDTWLFGWNADRWSATLGL